MPRVMLQYFPIDAIEQLVDAIKNKFLPDLEIPVLTEFKPLHPQVLGMFKLFFVKSINDDPTSIMSSAPQPVKDDILAQFANCRLLCKIARDAGLDELAIPKEVASFLAEIPAEVLLDLNLARRGMQKPSIEENALEYSLQDYDIQ